MEENQKQEESVLLSIDLFSEEYDECEESETCSTETNTDAAAEKSDENNTSVKESEDAQNQNLDTKNDLENTMFCIDLLVPEKSDTYKKKKEFENFMYRQPIIKSKFTVTFYQKNCNNKNKINLHFSDKQKRHLPDKTGMRFHFDDKTDIPKKVHTSKTFRGQKDFSPKYNMMENLDKFKKEKLMEMNSWKI